MASAPWPSAARSCKPIDHDAYETVTTLKRLEHWIARARESGRVCVDTETTSLDAMQARLVRRVAGGGAGRGLLHSLRPSAGRRPCLRGGSGDLVQMKEAEVLARLKPLLEDDSVLKIGTEPEI